MKSSKIIQNTIISLSTLFVITSSVRMLIHILSSESFGLLQVGVFGLICSFIGFMYYVLVTLNIQVWKGDVTVA